MGVSESRMRKLMDGHRAGRSGVAAKVGALVETIGAGGWCEEQASLMRALAYGILDPDGERHRLAKLHSHACPACRAYVRSLRGLAAVLPPVPALLQLALGGTAGAGGAAGTAAAATSAAGTGAGAAGGPLSASGAVGVGAAGGGWWLAGGPLGAKLAVGCLLVLGVGAGCAALEGGFGTDRSGSHRRHAHRDARLARPRARDAAVALVPRTDGEAAAQPARLAASPTRAGTASKAAREFGPEQAAAGASASTSTSGGSRTATASAASAGAAGVGRTSGSGTGGSSGASAASARPRTAGVSAAEREFSPG